MMHIVGATVEGYQVAKRVREAKCWLVRSGENVVGPVSLELIERGLEAGKVPPDAAMAYAEGGPWRAVGEIFAIPVKSTKPARPNPPLPRAERNIPAPPRVPPPPPVLVPPPPPSLRFPEEPISIPKQGVLAALFG